MNEQNILNVANRWEFRAWLEAHASVEAECWVAVKRGRPSAPEVFYYLDAVEEALCFGWVDSVQKLIDGKRMQRFSPRRSNSPWTELNKARVRRLESLGRMTDAWSKFRSFPALYQRVRAYNVAFYKNRAPEIYQKALAHLIEETKRGRMFGEWNDYGRLPDD